MNTNGRTVTCNGIWMQPGSTKEGKGRSNARCVGTGCFQMNFKNVKINNMTEQEKIKYFQMALAIVGIKVDEQTADLVGRVYEGVKKKKGNFSIKDAVAIEFAVKCKIDEKEVVTKSEAGECSKCGMPKHPVLGAQCASEDCPKEK